MTRKSLANLAFTSDGVIPPGDYAATLDEIQKSLFVAESDPVIEGWDAHWRHQLVTNLGVLAHQLWAAGVSNIFIDGSFVEDKGHPNDIDGYFECNLAEFASGRLEEALNHLDEHKIWTWDPLTRRPFRGYPKKQLPMWHQYRVELYPHYGQGTGILDEFGNEFEFPSLFRQQRHTGNPKGIIALTQG